MMPMRPNPFSLSVRPAGAWLIVGQLLAGISCVLKV
jgi:hypothetical protein